MELRTKCYSYYYNIIEQVYGRRLNICIITPIMYIGTNYNAVIGVIGFMDNYVAITTVCVSGVL